MSTKSKEQIARRREIKQAKKDFKETIAKNPEGFQAERLKLQAHAIDVKSKSRATHSIEFFNEEKVEGLHGKPGYTQAQYQGNRNLGYNCMLVLTQ